MRVPIVLAMLAVGCSVDVSVGRVERCALGLKSDVIADVEVTINRPFEIERTYHRLDNVFPNAAELASAAQGRTLLTSFKPITSTGETFSWARVADPGDTEVSTYLVAIATRMRDFGQPIFVVFHDEPDQDAVFGTPVAFIGAWQRVVQAFRDVGADNVTWVWTLASTGYPTQADALYPGDEWVDWIGATGFNWYKDDPASQWRTFASVFASFVEWAEPRGKPLMIVSTATGENPLEADDAPESKPTWIRQALDTVTETPSIQALVWHYDSGETNPYKDWRIDSSAASLDAFRELSSDPHFDVSGLAPPR